MVLATTDYFADTAEIASLLHVGTSADSTEFSETDLDEVLPIIQGVVHDFLLSQGLISAAPVVSTTTGYYTIKNVLVTMLQDWNQRRQANKLNNQTGTFPNTSYYPNLTDAMKIDLATVFLPTETDSIDVIPTYRGQYHEV